MLLSDPKRISLWLLPPDKLKQTLTSTQLDIISNHPKDQPPLPVFEPHVTLIGGVPILDCCSPEQIASIKEEALNSDIEEEAAKIVLNRLRLAFQSHGGVECNFVKERGVFAAREEDGTVKWNQSCVCIMERSKSLIKAMKAADKAMHSTTIDTSDSDNVQSIEHYFKPPLCEPHYSFVYGNNPELIPAALECPPSFISTEFLVVWTSPPSLKGVRQWETVGKVSMVQSCHL